MTQTSPHASGRQQDLFSPRDADWRKILLPSVVAVLVALVAVILSDFSGGGLLSMALGIIALIIAGVNMFFFKKLWGLAKVFLILAVTIGIVSIPMGRERMHKDVANFNHFLYCLDRSSDSPGC